MGGEKTNTLQGGHIPVIALTGNLDDESRRQCQEAGMDDFLAKPFTLEAVSRIIQHFSSSSVTNDLSNEALVAGFPSVDNNVKEEGLRRIAELHLQSVYPLEAEQLAELLEESVISLKQSIKRASRALELNHLDTLESIAHKMKGTLMGLGLETQIELARSLHSSAKQNDIKVYTFVFVS